MSRTRTRFRTVSLGLALASVSLLAPRLARADEPATAPPAPPASSGMVMTPSGPTPASQAPGAQAPGAAAGAEAGKSVVVELSADDGRATIERRVGTQSASGMPLVETGILSVGTWEHQCIAPCVVKLDPRFAYRVAGDGLVPTDSFALPHDGSKVRVDAKMGSSTGRVLGAIGGVVGGLEIATGVALLIATPILADNDVGSKGFRTAVLGGGIGFTSLGLVTAGVGLGLWLANGSQARTESVAKAISKAGTF